MRTSEVKVLGPVGIHSTGNLGYLAHRYRVRALGLGQANRISGVTSDVTYPTNLEHWLAHTHSPLVLGRVWPCGIIHNHEVMLATV